LAASRLMGLTHEQTFFIVTLSCYTAAALLLWRSWVMKPFKLWTTFMHEFSHATGAWLCCHQVTGIEVHADEGGLTHWRGNNVECAKHLVVPAGYLGSCIWGCAIFLSTQGGDMCLRIMSLVLCAALLVCLLYAVCGQTKDPGDRLPLIFLSLGFMAVLGSVTVLCFIHLDGFTWCNELLEAMVIWLGVLNMIYATVDIYDDTVRRTDERSDAYVYAQMWPCCFPKCVGVIWLLLAIAAFGSTIYVSFKWGGTFGTGRPAEFDAYLPGPIVLGVAIVLRFLLPCIAFAGSGKEKSPLLG